MKTLFRLGVLAVVFALLVSAVALPVYAQGGATNGCFDLKADDCKLITDGGAALTKVTSTNFSWSLSLKTEGAPEAGSLDLSGKGSVIQPPASTGTTPSTGNPMGAALGELTTVQFQTTITSQGKMGPQDLSGSLELRIVGGSLYIMSDKLTGGKWQALKLDEAMSSAMSMASGMSGAGGASGLPGSNNPMSGLMSNPDLLAAIAQAPNIPGVIKVTRDADQDATDKSEKYAHFTYTVDLVTMVKAKEFLPIVKAIAAQAMASRLSGAGGGAATPAAAPELTDEQAAQFVTMLADALKDVRIQAVVAVGLDSKTLRGLGFSLSATIDPKNAMIAAMMSGSAALTQPVKVDFSVSLELSNLNKGDKVEVPAGATTVTIAELMQGLMGGMVPGGVPGLPATPAAQ